MAKKENKSKKNVMKIITPILVPILIIVLVAGAFFAILYALTEMVKNLVANFFRMLFDILKQPVKWIKAQWAKLTNWFDRKFDTSETFNADNYELQGRIDPTMVIETTTFEEMTTNLENMINRNAAGLDDVMLKKMLLTYYRGIYLDDTTVLIELTKEDLHLADIEYDKIPESAKKIKNLEIEYGFDGKKTISANTEASYNALSDDEKAAVIWASIFKAYEDKENTLAEILGDVTSGALTGAMVGGFLGVGGGPGAMLGAVVGLVEGVTDENNRKYQMKLTPEGKNWILDNLGDEFYPYDIIGGDYKNGIGEDGCLYLKSTGMVQIYVACDSCNGLEDEGTSKDSADCTECKKNKIKFFQSDILDQMYQKEYKNQLSNCTTTCKNGGKKCYAHNVLDYLKKCYTYGSETSEGESQSDYISMYSERKEIVESSDIEYRDESKDNSYENLSLWKYIKYVFTGKYKVNPVIRSIEGSTTTPHTLQNIFYSDKVSQYATPVELMLNLLEISQSKDFVNAFIETVGNENYIKLKLYSMRNKEIDFISESFNRESTITAKRDIAFTAEVTAKKVDNILIDSSWTSEGLDGVSATPIPDETNSTLKIQLNGGKKGYLYKVKYYINGSYVDEVDIGSNTFLFWGGTSWTTGNIVVSPRWIDTWSGSSKIVRRREVTNVTDQYCAAISEIKTWYGTYKATNTIDRSYEVLKRSGGSEELQDTNVYFEPVSIDLGETINIVHRDSFNAIELYDRLLKSEIEVDSVEYNSVESWDNNWKTVTTTTFSEDNDDILDYDKVPKNPDVGMAFSEEAVRSYHLSFIMQEEAENKKDYNWFKKNKYLLSELRQRDTGLEVIDIKFSYTETLNEGIMEGQVVDGVIIDGDVITTDECMYTFLGLLSNSSGDYKLGEMFLPATSGGSLVVYDDLYGGTSVVGALLDNGDEMLYTLLEESTRTQGLVPVMKYAMYLYRNNNYIIVVEDANEWAFNIFLKNNMESVFFNKEEMKPV